MSERQSPATRPNAPLGFTLAELLVVVTLSTIGFVAIMNLQLGTIRGVGSARGMQNALGIAEHVAMAMRQEAIEWTPASPALSSISTFTFLKNAPDTTDAGSAGPWLIGYQDTAAPAADARISPGGASPTLDAGIRGDLGTDIDRNFCVHYRLTWLVPNMLLRADIRVSWTRPTANSANYQACPVTMIDRMDEVQSVSLPVTILRNVFVRQV
ncbi:MAG: hypothetical protein IV100_25535 [Myxococcales bacterium]|nr:hypothetical protein [Myxococcales bacterium]